MNAFEQKLRYIINNRKAFKACKPVYAGNLCVIRLDNGNSLQLEIVQTTPNHGIYGGLRVTARDASGVQLGVRTICFCDYCEAPYVYLKLDDRTRKLDWFNEPEDDEIEAILKEAHLFATCFGLA